MCRKLLLFVCRLALGVTITKRWVSILIVLPQIIKWIAKSSESWEVFTDFGLIAERSYGLWFWGSVDYRSMDPRGSTYGL